MDDLPWIFKSNLMSPFGFWFDCVTSIPWSCLDFHTHQVYHPMWSGYKENISHLTEFSTQLCEMDATGVRNAATNDNDRALRILKIFRILRIVRILKLAKFAL